MEGSSGGGDSKHILRQIFKSDFSATLNHHVLILRQISHFLYIKTTPA